MGMTLICQRCGKVFDTVKKPSATGAPLLYLYLADDPPGPLRFVVGVVGIERPLCPGACRGELVEVQDDRAKVD